MFKTNYLTLLLILLLSNIVTGQISFQESTSNSFSGVFGSGSAFFDADNDGDLDLIFSGFDVTTTRVTKLFLNNGGIFLEDLNNNFTGIVGGDIDFGDVDGDNDLDLIINGAQSATLRTAKLYINDSGIFTEDTGTNFEGTFGGSVKFLDFDNDSDLDILITGLDNTNTEITSLYENNNGNYTLIQNTPFIGLAGSSIAIGDIDNNGFVDVFLIGEDSNNNRHSDLYLNNNGSFSLDTSNNFEGVRVGDVALSDFDNNGFLDVILTGQGVGNVVTKLYFNNNGMFIEDTSSPFLGFSEGEIAFSDVDNNNFTDVLLSGNVTRLYSNVNGIFTDTNLNFDNVTASSVSFGDIDGDGKEDIFLAGTSGGADDAIAKLYINQSTLDITTFNYTEMTLFPNPATNLIRFDTKFQLSDDYIIYNDIGKIVMKGHVENNEIEVSSLTVGFYIIRFPERKENFKFLKQ